MEKILQVGGNAVCQAEAAAERFRLVYTLSDRFPLPDCTSHWFWPAAAATPGGNGSSTKAGGPGRTQSSRPRDRGRFSITVASTSKHATLKSSGPLALMWVARVLTTALFRTQSQELHGVKASPGKGTHSTGLAEKLPTNSCSIPIKAAGIGLMPAGRCWRSTRSPPACRPKADDWTPQERKASSPPLAGGFLEAIKRSGSG